MDGLLQPVRWFSAQMPLSCLPLCWPQSSDAMTGQMQ